MVDQSIQFPGLRDDPGPITKEEFISKRFQITDIIVQPVLERDERIVTFITKEDEEIKIPESVRLVYIYVVTRSRVGMLTTNVFVGIMDVGELYVDEFLVYQFQPFHSSELPNKDLLIYIDKID